MQCDAQLPNIPAEICSRAQAMVNIPRALPVAPLPTH
jgi:hypothetical protein